MERLAEELDELDLLLPLELPLEQRLFPALELLLGHFWLFHIAPAVLPQQQVSWFSPLLINLNTILLPLFDACKLAHFCRLLDP